MNKNPDLKNNFLLKICEKKKNQTLFIVFSSLSLAVMIAIFLFSAQPAEYSAELSGNVGSIVEKLLSYLKWFLSDGAIIWVKNHIRKIAHFIGYSFLGGFLLGAFLNTIIKKLKVKIFLSAIIGLIYSMTDEFHQLFVRGRSGQISDVILDFCGVSTGIIIALIIYGIIKKSAKSDKKS